MRYALRGARQDPAAATCTPRPVARWRRLAQGWAWAVAGGAAVVVALPVPAVWTDARGLLAHGVRLPWLGAAAAAEVAWLAGLVVAQRQLLAAAGARLPARAVAAVVFASTGLAALLPAGPATAAAWQAGQYRRRGAGRTAGVWAVLAGGFASAIVILAMLVAGATTAGVGRWWLFPAAAAMAAGTAAVLTAARRAERLARHPGRSWRSRLAAGLAGVAGHRVGPRRGAGVLAASSLSVLGEAGLLAASFGVAGTPVPWRGLMLACAASQLGGTLVPLPGGLGGVEGGALGALALSGTHPATAAGAVIVYRVARYWVPGAAGAVAAATLTRRHPAPPAAQPSRRSARRHPRWGTPWPLPGSRTAPGMQRCPRRPPSPRGRSCLPPGPQKVTAMPARPGRERSPSDVPCPADRGAGGRPGGRRPVTAWSREGSAAGPGIHRGCGPPPAWPTTSAAARGSSSADENKIRNTVMATPLARRPEADGASPEPQISAVRGGASLVRQPPFAS
jgi:uncharacterized membrane protein YbhN (UPF0104 family)